MPEFLASLSDAQMRQVKRLAIELGVSVEEAASIALSERIAEKFVIAKRIGNVLPFQGLKRPKGKSR